MTAADWASLAFDRIADQYDSTRGGLERARRAAAAIAALLPSSPSAEPVLEIGVGTGIVAAELGRPVVGVDLSRGMLARAAARLPGRLAVADARALPFASGSIGGVYASLMLHLVGDAEPVLAEAARVLRPGGVLVTTVSSGEPPPRSDVGAVLSQLEAAVGRPGERPDKEDTVVEIAGRHGLRLAGRATFAGGHQQQVPSEAAARIANRSWSWMWRCDDETWEAAARVALARLAELPDQDVPRAGEVTYPLVALVKD